MNPINNPIMLIVLIVLIVLLFLELLLFRLAKGKTFIGWAGEMLLNWKLKNGLDKKLYIVMHNIMLPTDDGTTTQIDHIVVSQWGIFVIETKTYTGRIYGKSDEPQWTAKYNWRQKGFTFQNPVRQNYKHIATLSECLGLEQKYFKNLVAFHGLAKFGKEMPSEVMKFRQVVDYIKDNSKETIIPQGQIREVAETILSWQSTLSHAQKAAHVENLQKTHSKPKAECKPKSQKAVEQSVSAVTETPSQEEAPLCPKCGVSMVKRNRKSDGVEFWGCPNYPKCRAVINIDK